VTVLRPLRQGGGGAAAVTALVARCLAAVARCNAPVGARSAITGEPGLTTVHMVAPRELRSSEVLAAVRKLLARAAAAADAGAPRDAECVRQRAVGRGRSQTAPKGRGVRWGKWRVACQH
jgi:hypothetical protein